MKLRELITVIRDYVVIKVVDARSISVFHGEVSIVDGELVDRYMDAAVCDMYPEYFKGWGKVGITIIVQPVRQQEVTRNEG